MVDGAEHLIDAVRAAVREVLEQGPLLRVILTSRVPVGVPGERMIAVRPLAASFDGEGDEEGLEHPPAVALFVERCGRLGDPVSFTATEVATIAEICRRVDGLPLGIELAAARSGTLGVSGLLRRLGARLDLVAAHGPAAGERHGSLRRVIEWSYGLLDAAAQRLLARLSVFAASFSFDHVEQMWSDEHPGELLTAFETLDRNSLLTRDASMGVRRFRLLDTVAEFARERLDEFDETDDAHERLIAWVLAITARPDLQMGAVATMFDEVEADADNVRHAIVWAIDHLSPDDAANLGAALYVWWMTCGRRTELGSWLEALVSRELHTTRTAALLNQCLGRILHQGGHLDEAEHHLTVALTLWAGLGHPIGVTSCCTTLAELSANRESFDEALQFIDRARRLAGETQDTESRMRILAAEAFVALRMEHFEQAIEVSEAMQAILAESGWVGNQVKAMSVVGHCHRALGNLQRAAEVLDYAVKLAVTSNSVDALEHALAQQALTSARVGDGRTLEVALRCLNCLPDSVDPWAVFYSAIAIAIVVPEAESRLRERAYNAARAVQSEYPHVRMLSPEQRALGDVMRYLAESPIRQGGVSGVAVQRHARLLAVSIQEYLALSGANSAVETSDAQTV